MRRVSFEPAASAETRQTCHDMSDDERGRELEAHYGHPGEKWLALREWVGSRSIQQFAEVQDRWLDLMWTLDQYRIASVPPRGMGNPATQPGPRLGAIYRGKGNWFAELLALLLQNLTSLPMAPRQRVQGFSQEHQIDLAWPARKQDVRVCAETKVTGAPGYGDTPPRASRDDFSNRRKELKFAATDLKLYRRQHDTSIEHWGVWREQASPKAYFLWAARMTPGRDHLKKVVEEAQALVNTYLDGAGIFAWQEDSTGTRYEALVLPQSARVTDLDDVLLRIASEVKAQAGPGRTAPPVVTPDKSAVETAELAPDPDPTLQE